MNNYEYMKNISLDKMSHYLCDLMEEVNDGWGCDICPVSKYCRPGRNGFRCWLEAEHDKHK